MFKSSYFIIFQELICLLCCFLFWVNGLTKLETGLFTQFAIFLICTFHLDSKLKCIFKLKAILFLIGWGGFFISSIGLTGFGRFKGRSVVTQFAILLIFQIVFHFGPEVCFFDQPHIKQQINQEGLCLSIHPHHQLICQTFKPKNKK